MNPSPPLETPVVLVFFNRPERVQQVFARIAAARPRQLFLIADGPRPGHPEDPDLVAAARQAVQAVDWKCEVHCDFSEVNLGVKRRVSSGLDRVFAQVERAIILEDDCLPHPSFFPFCQELLERYAGEPQVRMIAGSNFQLGQRRPPYSYYFSIYPHIWGWATWATAWASYDGALSRWPQARREGLLEDYQLARSARRYWRRRFQATYEGKIDSWAYAWMLACWLENGLSIIPSVNLVSNIGFGDAASHTLGRRNPLSNLPVEALEFPLAHPPLGMRFPEADAFTQRVIYREHWLAPLKKRLKQLFK